MTLSSLPRTTVRLSLLIAAFALMACGDDGTTMTDTSVPIDGGDSGVGDSAMPDGMMDSSTVGAPYVVTTRPEEGDENVAIDTRVLILFSEEMSTSAGTVTVEPGGLTLDASAGLWIGDEELMIDNDPLRENIAVVLDFPAVLTGGVEYMLTVNTDFQDAEGVGLDEAYPFFFITADMQQPTVTECTPAEGASGLSAVGVTEITCTFDEEMNTAIGSARLTGGPGRLGDAVWDLNTVSWPLTEPIAYDATYRVELTDFFDRNGNELDGSAYLGDGVLDFSTGPDNDAPRILTSVPSEGMRGVNPALRSIVIEFDEPMNPSVTTADLSDGATTTTLNGTWSMGDQVLTLDSRGALDFDTTYTLDIGGAGLEDLAGNALDTTTYLVDGVLDFVVEDDTFGPRVIDSTPNEGATDVDFAIPVISVRFDEPMDTSTDRVTIVDSTGDMTTVTGTWDGSGQILDFDVRDVLFAGEMYSLDFTGYRDTTGNLLDDSDAYLGDGSLDFGTIPPSGDSCAEVLTIAEATSTGGGVTEWNLPSGDYNDDGSTDSCDSDSSGGSDDLVIEYIKTSGDLASGGSLLHVTVESGSTTDVNLELRQGSCDPEDGDEPILGCQETLETGGITRDVGPGTYYIWVAKETGGTFPGATVRVEELGAWPLGSSCNAPFDTTSSPGMIYLAPERAGDPHVYQIRPNLISTYDRGVVSNDEGEISCSSQHGSDAVVRFDKMAGSVLTISAIPVDIRSSAGDLNIEVSLGCDPADSAYTSLACEDNFDRRTSVQVTGPAGPVYIWISSDDRDATFPGATITVDEIMVGPGESCGTARPLTASPAAVTLDSTASLGAGGCLDAGDEITWFSYTPTEDIAIVTGDTADTILLADQETNQPLVCNSDATQATPALIRAGRTVCIGINNRASIATLTTSELPYTGIRGVVTDLGFTRPFDDMGAEMTWNDDAWLTVNDSTLFMGVNGSTFSGPGPRVFFGPKAGMTRLVDAPGVTSSHIGDVGIAIGDELFGLDDTFSSSLNHVWKLYDGMAFPWAPEAWDTPGYNDDTIAMTYDGTNLIVVDQDCCGSPTDFYAIDPTTSGTRTLLGTNTVIDSVSGVAADATYFYILGRLDMAFPDPDIEGLWRLARADLATPSTMPLLMAELDINTFQGQPIFVDDTTTATALYFRRAGVFSQPNQVHAVLNPGSASPLYLGPILRLGTSNDYAMAYDRAANSLYLYESETTPDGRIVRVD